MVCYPYVTRMILKGNVTRKNRALNHVTLRIYKYRESEGNTKTSGGAYKFAPADLLRNGNT